MKHIHLWGARQNNLKGVEVEIPLGSFTVICGPSGSGKSSLAFETLYAEGQRRYIESLSNYTKQFLNKAPKPDLDGIENIPPAISIEQKNSVKSSRSTVGTTTEVVDYLRLLFEKIGKAYCPSHHIHLERESPTLAAQKILQHFEQDRGYILAPILADSRLLEGKKLMAELLHEGFLRIYVPTTKTSKTSSTRKTAKTAKKRSTKKVLHDLQSGKEQAAVQAYFQEPLGEVIDLNDPRILKKGLPKTDFYIVIDRLAFRSEDQNRLVDSLAQAYSTSVKYNKDLLSAQAKVLTVEGRGLLLSEDHSCSVCGFKFPPITSALFSFNSPVGACSSCNGFGNTLSLDESKIIPDPSKTLAQGAIAPLAMPSAASDRKELRKFCTQQKIDLHKAWQDLPAKHQKMIWEGTKDFYGVVGLFDYLETKKYKMHVRIFLSRYKSPFTCKSCQGTRLKPESQQVLIAHQSISDLCSMTVTHLLSFLNKLELSPAEDEVCKEPFRQLKQRLFFLEQVGVGYLTLDRPTKTLSGGEYQRLNLANQLGMGLSQTLYVLDEPTVGLHPRDNDRLIGILQGLKNLGNTLVVVEHDYDVIKSSSHIIEMGPGSGHLGGQVIYSGPTADFYSCPQSITAPYLKTEQWVPLRSPRPVHPKTYKYMLSIEGCSGHNLKNISIDIPLNRLVTITGVSGSGKSTLISQTLYPAIARHLHLEYIQGQAYKTISGLEHVKNLIFIDQSPVGKTARSSPVTYLKVFDAIRNIMAATPESQALGYSPGTFSLNVDGGRCPVCKGLGFETVDMLFMDDIEIQCEACDGKRFRPEILDITYKGKNIHEILKMTVAEAMEFFVNFPNIRRPLALLREVGLEYLCLGQSARSLSGGESQRLKIARELNATQQRGTLYIMDEPTTGLHFREVDLLLKVLNRLIEAGGSVILIEHNLEIIKNSDYLIDLGPEAGTKGGHLVAVGTPSELIKTQKGYTGKYLKQYIEQKQNISAVTVEKPLRSNKHNRITSP